MLSLSLSQTKQYLLQDPLGEMLRFGCRAFSDAGRGCAGVRGPAFHGEQLWVFGGAPGYVGGKVGKPLEIWVPWENRSFLLSHPKRSESWNLGRTACA